MVWRPFSRPVLLLSILRLGLLLFRCEAKRIYRDSVQTDFIVQMGARGAAGIAKKGNDLAPLHLLPLFYEDLLQVRIDRVEAETMIQADDLS